MADTNNTTKELSYAERSALRRESFSAAPTFEKPQFQAPESYSFADFGKDIVRGTINSGQDIAGAIIGGEEKYLNESADVQNEVLTNLTQAIQEKRAKGENTDRLMNELVIMNKRKTTTINDINPSLAKTNKQIVGDFGMLGLEALGFGALRGTAKAGSAYVLKTGTASTFLKEAMKTGVYLAPYEASRAASDNKSLKEIAKAGGAGFVTGTAFAGGLFAGAWALPKAANALVKGVESTGGAIGRTRLGSFATQELTSVYQRIADTAPELGTAKIAESLKLADRQTLKEVGEWMARLDQAGLFVNKPAVGSFQRITATLASKAGFKNSKIVKDYAEKRAGSFATFKAMEGKAVDQQMQGSLFGGPSAKSFNTTPQQIDETAVQVGRAFFDDVAEQASSRDLQILTRNKFGESEWVPFTKRENYVPHVIETNPTRLRQGHPDREFFVQNALIDGKFSNKLDAEEALDGWIQILDNKHKRNFRVDKNKYVDHLVAKGYAENKDDAWQMVYQQLGKAGPYKKSAFLESSRDFDHPFYKPFIEEVIPLYAHDAIGRVKMVDQFGVRQTEEGIQYPAIEKVLEGIRRQDPSTIKDEELHKLIKVALSEMSFNPTAEEISSLLRTVQVPKLIFAQIPTVMSGFIQPYLKSDVGSLLYGLKKSVGNRNTREALKTGATLHVVQNELYSAAAGGKQFADDFFRLTGFNAAERWARTVAAHTGMRHAQKTVDQLKKAYKMRAAAEAGTEGGLKTGRISSEAKGVKYWDSAIEYYKGALDELGLDPANVIKQKKLTDDQLRMSGQLMSEMTHFRTRPGDMPAFAAHPIGKVMFQFKSFVYQQTRMLFKLNTIENLRKGGKPAQQAMRNLLVLATIYPMAGEVAADIRSLLTGSERPTDALDRYVENLAASAAAGVMLDIVNSSKYDSFTSFVAGPTIGTAAGIVDSTVDREGQVDPEGLLRETLRQTGILRPLSNIGQNKRPSSDREPFAETIGLDKLIDF